MSQKPAASKPSADTQSTKRGTPSHPGMMGDGTEEQNLNQAGDPAARITEGEVKDAFAKEKKA